MPLLVPKVTGLSLSPLGIQTGYLCLSLRAYAGKSGVETRSGFQESFTLASLVGFGTGRGPRESGKLAFRNPGWHDPVLAHPWGEPVSSHAPPLYAHCETQAAPFDV